MAHALMRAAFTLSGNPLYYYPVISPHAAAIFVGQVGNLRPMGGALWARPALWGSQSYLSSWACDPPNGMKAHRGIVGQVGNLRPIGNRPVAIPNVFSTGCAGLSTVQPAFSRLLRQRAAPVGFCR